MATNGAGSQQRRLLVNYVERRTGTADNGSSSLVAVQSPVIPRYHVIRAAAHVRCVAPDSFLLHYPLLNHRQYERKPGV
ncbi:hypothetical protein BaRGS_00005008 [Batillaria attramentaria]|uniref:Uncharacterized protein n=1 Tax=Batillaria attramentaria TaxID=370345 RepID=A0ABD0LW65_9CAEN